MAKAEFKDLVKALSGKVNKDHSVYFRQIKGKTYAVELQNPRTSEKASKKEKALRKRVGEQSKEASRINKDEALAAEYNDWAEHGYSTRYRYILARLIKGE